MRTFVMYRRGDLSATHAEGTVNAPDAPQFEGVVFSDGSVALRWLTAFRSTSVWESLDEALAVHGHPEYDSELVWASTNTEGGEQVSLDEKFKAVSERVIALEAENAQLRKELDEAVRKRELEGEQWKAGYTKLDEWGKDMEAQRDEWASDNAKLKASATKWFTAHQKLTDVVAGLNTENARLRAALEFYGYSENHVWTSHLDADGERYVQAQSAVDKDGGAIARAALTVLTALAKERAESALSTNTEGEKDATHDGGFSFAEDIPLDTEGEQA